MNKLHPVLSDRIRTINGRDTNAAGRYILYLPTVVLRKQHNAAFALACRWANEKQLPLITLAVVLDDANMPIQTELLAQELGHDPIIVFTARRIAFVLEALQSATRAWSEHGSGVLIRVHGTNARHPHHLTLARNAAIVVTDEPFVQPYINYVRAVERAATGSVYRVDSSTTVPPVAVLRPAPNGTDIDFYGVPGRAYQWESMTASKRKKHVLGAAKEGLLDAPPLDIRLSDDFMFSKEDADRLSMNLPAEWIKKDTHCPDRRPWTVQEISQIVPKRWVLQWDGIDTSVPPCEQTNGSNQAGDARWNAFLEDRMSGYAKKRNDINQPHAVSRMSCYLNYGVVSIFSIVADLWDTKTSTKKFEDEIIKWREIGYTHAIANPYGFNGIQSVPTWAKKYLQKCRAQSYSVKTLVPLQKLESASSKEAKWNAMQNYLVQTGELHNNARMTWGKTIVHWQKYDHDVELLLAEMVYLNDRFALDGLSPPSYAGLLWCLGWCDKVGSALTEKPSSRYRASAQAFETARQKLLSGTTESSQKRKRKEESFDATSPSIKDYFTAVG